MKLLMIAFLLTSFSCRHQAGDSASLLAEQGDANDQKNDNDAKVAGDGNLFERLDLKVIDIQSSTYILEGCRQLHGLLDKGIEVFNKEMKAQEAERFARNFNALGIDLSKYNKNQQQIINNRAKALWNYEYKKFPVNQLFPGRRPTNVTHVIVRLFAGGTKTPIVYLNEGANGMTMDIINRDQMYRGLSGTSGWLWGMAYGVENCKVSSRNGTISEINRNKTLDAYGNEIFQYVHLVNGTNASAAQYQVHNLAFIDTVVRGLDSHFWKSNAFQRQFLVGK